MDNWKQLWLKNYRGEEDTKDLADFVKKLNYGNRNNVSYLPWATVERIFRLQGGTIEILKVNDTIVEADRVHVKDQVEDNGVVIPVYSSSYFVNIKVDWNGQTHIEKYPLQDSTGRPLSNWTQNEVNKSLQRGKVKAIAVISGIGFKLFEDGDLQFEEEEVKPVKTKKPEVIKPTPVVSGHPKHLDPLSIEPESETTVTRTIMENEIKKQFLSGAKEKADNIRAFLSRNDVKRISELDDDAIQVLYELVSR